MRRGGKEKEEQQRGSWSPMGRLPPRPTRGGPARLVVAESALLHWEMNDHNLLPPRPCFANKNTVQSAREKTFCAPSF